MCRFADFAAAIRCRTPRLSMHHQFLAELRWPQDFCSPSCRQMQPYFLLIMAETCGKSGRLIAVQSTDSAVRSTDSTKYSRHRLWRTLFATSVTNAAQLRPVVAGKYLPCTGGNPLSRSPAKMGYCFHLRFDLASLATPPDLRSRPRPAPTLPPPPPSLG